MDCNQICFLCLANCNDSISIFDTKVGEHLLQEVLRQHFWFEFNDTTKNESEVMCSICMQKLKDFHEFYSNIRDIHCTIKDNPAGIISIKTEKDIHIYDSNDPSDIDVKIAVSDTCGNDTSLIVKTRSNRKPNKTVPQDYAKIKKIERDEESEVVTSDDEDKDGYYEIVEKKSKSRKSKVKTKVAPIKSQKKRKNIKTRNRVENGKEILEKQQEKLLLNFSMRCELCSIPVESLVDARNHYRAEHDRNGYLTCCGRRFFKYYRIVEHLAYHENPTTFTCTICSKSFMDGHSLRDHNEIHASAEDRIYKCDQCHRSYSKKHTLNYHMKIMHSKEEDKKFKCGECGRKFAIEGSLRAHAKKVHEYADSRICDICAKFFKCAQSYDLHYKVVHTNLMQKVQCDLCGIWLKHRAILREHMKRQHEKPKTPEICKHCGKEAPHIKALRAHIKFNHSNISFPCHICNKTFKKTTTLKEHMAIHTGEKALYTCSFCPKTFRSNANMYAHRKRAHPFEYQQSKLLGTKYNNTDESIVI